MARNVTVNITIPTQSNPVPVKSVFGWIMFHQRLGYTFNFDRSWAEYKGGFGSIDADFWLGLEKVHLLTSSQPYKLRVEAYVRTTNLWYSSEYWSFNVGDELNDGYRLDVSGYSGDAADSLQYDGDLNGDGGFGRYNYKGMKFTTYDQDNDLQEYGNCAVYRGGGWWFNRCYWVCFTCDEDLSEWSYYILNSRMMIKPQD